MTLTCGHQENKGIEYGGIPVSIKEYTRYGTRTVSYQVICKECYSEYDKQGILLKSKEEELNYLREED